MRTTLGTVLLLLALGACSSSRGGGGDDDGDAVGDDDGDDVAEPPDARPDPSAAVRFIAFGDAGEDNDAQLQVAATVKNLCDARGCDFVLLLGDNIYDDGVTGVDDPQWQTKFEIPYQHLDMPFYAALGNHDYGGQISIFDAPGVGNEFEKGLHEVAYTAHSDKWRMPATHYTLRFGNLGIIVLDTNSILWDNTDHGDQRAWWPTALAEVEGAEWVFVAGHHPYRSNGTHGDAGSYDAPELIGIPVPNPLPIQNGAAMKSFFDEVVCGTGDLYLSGHDHSRQWINEPTELCGTEMIVSGAGAKVTDIAGTTNETFYQDATKFGFAYIVVDGNQVVGQFYDADGNLDFERTITH